MNNTIVNGIKKYKSTLIKSLVTATILLVTLAWNDYVQSVANLYIGKFITLDGIYGKLYYALLITAIVITFQIYVFPFIDYEK